MLQGGERSRKVLRLCGPRIIPGRSWVPEATKALRCWSPPQSTAADFRPGHIHVRRVQASGCRMTRSVLSHPIFREPIHPGVGGRREHNCSQPSLSSVYPSKLNRAPERSQMPMMPLEIAASGKPCPTHAQKWTALAHCRQRMLRSRHGWMHGAAACPHTRGRLKGLQQLDPGHSSSVAAPTYLTL